MWKNNSMEGKGVYFYKHGKLLGDRYEGDFRNGKMEGKGIYYKNNGNRIVGDYLNDIRTGKHVIIHSNGEISIIYLVMEYKLSCNN